MAWIDLTWPGVCAHFATLDGKRTVTKSHKASLNCLFTPKQQLLIQQMGAISLHWGICAESQVKAYVPGWTLAFHRIFQGGHMKSSIKALLAAAAGLAAFAV